MVENKMIRKLEKEKLDSLMNEDNIRKSISSVIKNYIATDDGEIFRPTCTGFPEVISPKG